MMDSNLYNNNNFPRSHGRWVVIIVVIVIALMFYLSACTPSKACRKWAAETYKPDTKIVKEFIFVPEIKVETEFVMQHDSLIEHFFIDKERLHIEIKRIRDTLYIKGRCDSVVIEVVKTVTVNVSKPCTEDEGQMCLNVWWIWVAGALLALITLILLISKLKNI